MAKTNGVGDSDSDIEVLNESSENVSQEEQEDSYGPTTTNNSLSGHTIQIETDQGVKLESDLEEEEEVKPSPRLRGGKSKPKYDDQDVTDEESNSDDEEFNPTAKRFKPSLKRKSDAALTSFFTPPPLAKASPNDPDRSLCCRQLLSSIGTTGPGPEEALSEDHGLRDERVVVEGAEEMAYLLLTDYSFYDMNQHLVPLDVGLVEAGKRIYFKGIKTLPGKLR